ncbi:MAG: hypothetical protein R3192_10170, partial [Woeseiaceae bacterium]|nr:hypothetical protein [Woeseiaceae bacterium]
MLAGQLQSRSRPADDERLVLVGFAAALLFAWFCYQPALSGAFQFDDYFNLRGLAAIDDAAAAFEFIFSGSAGPTGRPLALASFALQAQNFEDGASPFLLVNILIHLCNGLLLASFLFQLARQQSIARNDASIIAAIAASLWLFMPLLATASLFVVQRMTTLSALFMLLGLNGYLFARAKLHVNARLALTSMSAVLVLFTALATLCKESGILLPVLVLVLEATVLPLADKLPARDWRVWQSIFLGFPLLVLLVYLATWLDWSDGVMARRGFTVWERLMTEARVLWLYLAKAVTGVPSRIGIYQEPPAMSRTLLHAPTLLAVIAWCALLAASIRWRRRYPLIALGVLWFLAGHLIESTVIPLDIYFEHRNYVPMIGPVFAITSIAYLHTGRYRRLAMVLLAGVWFVNSWSLYGFASLSGQPSMAARYWAALYPNSQRAVSRMANFQLLEEGPLNAVATIDAFADANPEHAYMRIVQLNLLCKAAPAADHSELVATLSNELPNAAFSFTSAVMLFELYATVASSQCNGVGIDTVTSLASILRDNPAYQDEP